MLLKMPSNKKLIYLTYSCGFILITIFLTVQMPSLEGVRIPRFFSKLYTVTDHLNTTASFSPDANVSKVPKNVSEEFKKSTQIAAFNKSHLNLGRTGDLFSKENVGITLTKIAKMHRLKEVSCSDIFNNSRDEIDRANQIANQVGIPISDEQYINLTSDCQKFKTERGYILSSLSEEEENFPLAFSIAVYTDTEMFERLLRAIYRPQNYYCINVDGSSDQAFFETISSIANCFPNVMLSSRRIDVQWGQFTVLESEIVCMEDLWKFPKWKYFFTLTGQEFPLKTNFELVKILTAFKGAVDVMTTVKYAFPERWMNSLPPRGLKPVKGTVHVVITRDFVDYALHNDTAQDLLNWTKNTFIPDETFFAILNGNPQLGIKGTYKGEPEITEERPLLARYKNWWPSPCAGAFVRSICILTLGDLPLLGQAKEMIANKFFLGWDRVVIGCLEEKMLNDTRDEYFRVKTFNTTYYSNLDTVKNQVT